MKNILLLLFLSPLLCFAQLEANNFKVTPEGRVIWQKVYEAPGVSFDDLVNTVKSNLHFSDIDIQEGKITFFGTGIETNPRYSGFSRGSTAIYALGEMEAYFTIDYKEGRYRITAINITANNPSVNLLSPAYSEYEKTPIENLVGNGKGLKKGFIKKESKIMSDGIEKEFTIIKDTSTDDNW